jgi:hypothetical protein
MMAGKRVKERETSKAEMSGDKPGGVTGATQKWRWDFDAKNPWSGKTSSRVRHPPPFRQNKIICLRSRQFIFLFYDLFVHSQSSF